MSFLGEVLKAVCGRWPPGEPPRRSAFIIADLALALMVLAVVVFWRGGDIFVYQGF